MSVHMDGTPVDHNVGLMRTVAEIMGIKWNVEYSSRLKLPAELRGQDRIIEIARQFGATDYLNSPGGIDLYDPQSFEQQGLGLSFLNPYEGSRSSILQRLNDEGLEHLRAEFAPLASKLNQGRA